MAPSDEDIDPTQPPQREQFETLYERITDAHGGFELDRLSPNADAYPAVWSLHPRFEIDEEQGVIAKREGLTSSQVIEPNQRKMFRRLIEPNLTSPCMLMHSS